jgi:hypothetical protein
MIKETRELTCMKCGMIMSIPAEDYEKGNMPSVCQAAQPWSASGICGGTFYSSKYSWIDLSTFSPLKDEDTIDNDPI